MHISLGDRRPNVADTAWVAPTAAVIGDVHIGEHVSIWYGAVLRADGDRITVEAGTNVQDNCVFHSDPGAPVHIGTGVSVGHGAIIHGATIEKDVIVGMGATVMNGARVGQQSLIAANALVPEGKTVPPGVLFAGVPGKVVRNLSKQELSGIRDNAQKCRELATTHATS
jgi:carbonic anhydrase/acetyltransferase-like protein (isoleucine patch superfamily)